MGRGAGVLIGFLVAVTSSGWAGTGPTRFRTVGPNVRLSIDQLATPQAPGGESQREPHIALDPTNRRHLLAGSIEGRRDADGFPLAMGYYESEDAGATWEAGLIPGVSEASGSTQYQFAVDPVVAFGPTGTAFFACVSFDEDGPSAIHVSRASEAGDWDPPVSVAADDAGFQRLDKPWIVVDQSAASPFVGRIYIAWTEFADAVSDLSTMNVSYSDDEGVTWSSPVSVTGDDQTIGAQILVEEDGAVTVLYFDRAGDRIRSVRSEDGGVTWEPPTDVADVERAPIPGQRTGEVLPSAAIDTATQTMHVVWQDSRRDVADVMHVRSTNSGSNWTDPQRVNGGPRGLESFDAAVAAAGGSVHVVFYDGRDKRDRQDLYNLYYAQSIDDGASFLKTNVRVTSRSFDIDYAAPSSRGLFLGDYIGIVATRRRAHAVWVDTRRPSQVTDAAGQNDVFSARIAP